MEIQTQCNKHLRGLGRRQRTKSAKIPPCEAFPPAGDPRGTRGLPSVAQGDKDFGESEEHSRVRVSWAAGLLGGMLLAELAGGRQGPSSKVAFAGQENNSNTKQKVGGPAGAPHEPSEPSQCGVAAATSGKQAGHTEEPRNRPLPMGTPDFRLWLHSPMGISTASQTALGQQLLVRGEARNRAPTEHHPQKSILLD